jgi:bacteriorhodopsin
MWSVDRGQGWKNCKPYGPKGPKELHALSFCIDFVTAFVYYAKALDLMEGGGSSFSLNKITYADYVLTCPMLILDFALTIDLRGKIRLTAFCWMILGMGVASFLAKPPYNFAYYGLDLFFFVCYFIYLAYIISERLPNLPPVGKKYLYGSMGVFFCFWPVFPIVWLLRDEVGGVISVQAFWILHGILDIICKSGYGLMISVYRMIVEDYHIDRAKMTKYKAVTVVDKSEVVVLLDPMMIYGSH